jgi:uncharacterized protein
MSYLPEGLPNPMHLSTSVSKPYWDGLRENRLLVQHCSACATWQFAPECLCHQCHAFEPAWQQIAPLGQIFSWERVWHPAHACLKQHGPYLVVLVELPQAGKLRMLGNLLGDPMQAVTIGAAVEGVFEHHAAALPPYSLLQWRLTRKTALA